MLKSVGVWAVSSKSVGVKFCGRCGGLLINSCRGGRLFNSRSRGRCLDIKNWRSGNIDIWNVTRGYCLGANGTTLDRSSGGFGGSIEGYPKIKGHERWWAHF